MIPRDQLPDDAADWAEIEVSLPRIVPDAEGSAPISLDDIFGYIQMESADLDAADRDRLSFCRTAQIFKSRMWLWKYTESDGVESFVTLKEDENGETTLGLAEPNGLSEEQFLLAEYYGEIYWS